MKKRATAVLGAALLSVVATAPRAQAPQAGLGGTAFTDIIEGPLLRPARSSDDPRDLSGVWFTRLYAQRMIRRSLVRGDRVIAVSQNTKADLMEYFEVDGTKIDVVYNGVDEAFRRHLPPDELSRALKSLEIERPYVLFVGNPAKKHKNLDNVVKAYARARQLGDLDAPLVCVGDRTAAGFKLRQRAAQLGIGDKVLLLGHVAPEAFVGGPIAAIHEGDTVVIDTDARSLNIDVSDEEIASRLAAWQRPEPRYKSGVLAKYASLVTSAAEGAVTKPAG